MSQASDADSRDSTARLTFEVAVGLLEPNDGSALELATVSGGVSGGMTATLTVGV